LSLPILAVEDLGEEFIDFIVSSGKISVDLKINNGLFLKKENNTPPRCREL
jgi:hypothetical protein